MVFINENDILIYRTFNRSSTPIYPDITSLYNIYPIMLAPLFTRNENPFDNLNIHKIVKQLCIKECCSDLFNDDSIYQELLIMPTNPNNKIIYSVRYH